MEKSEDDYRPCPLCAEPIRVAALKCRHCGSDVRDEAVDEFLDRGASIQDATPTSPIAPTEDSPTTGATPPFIARLTTGLVGHWVTLSAIGYMLLMVIFAVTTRSSGGGSPPSSATIKIFLSIFFVLGGIGYVLIGIGWTAAVRVATRHALGCAVASFLHTLVAIICIVAISLAKFGKRQEPDVEWIWMPLVIANGVYMLSLAYWYWAAGLNVLNKKGCGGFRTFLSHLGYPVLALFTGLMAFPAVFASDDKVKFICLLISMLTTIVCWACVWSHFYLFRSRLEALDYD